MKLTPRAAAAVLTAAVTSAIAGACTSTTDAILIAPITEIYVDPSSFLGRETDGGAPPLCGVGEGSLQTYVATIQDVTYDPAAGVNWLDAGVVDIPSSPPTRCSLRAAFGQVISGHMYVGQVDAYDLPVCTASQTTGRCLRPIGDFNSGSRTMVDLAGNPVPARWKTRCGDSTHRQADGGAPLGVISDAPTFASFELQLPLIGCEPLQALAPETPARLRVDVQALIQSHGCAEGTGIAKLVGTLRQTGETATSEVVAMGSTCVAPAFEFGGAAGLAPDTSFDVDVLAFAAGTGLPSLGTTCSAKTHISAEVTAPCGSLTSGGTIRVDVASLLASRKLTCSDVSLVKVATADSSMSASASCPSDVNVGGVSPGIYTLLAHGFLGDPASGLSDVFTSTCTATVTAGILTTATCD